MQMCIQQQARCRFSRSDTTIGADAESMRLSWLLVTESDANWREGGREGGRERGNISYIFFGLRDVIGERRALKMRVRMPGGDDG